MSELVVIGYDNQEQAELARNELFAMKAEHIVDLIDAVVATSDEKGRIRLNQMVNLWATGATSGALWGLLAGILFFHPLLGVALGGATGALAAAGVAMVRSGLDVIGAQADMAASLKTTVESLQVLT